MTFEDFGLSRLMLDALAKKGFEEPSPIQRLAIPKLLAPGKALAARARTGTGKTAAFGIPMIEALRDRPASEWGKGLAKALVLVPTRELALQVAAEISSLRSGDRPRVACVYGGASMLEQLRRLAAGVDIVVGTPGRVLDHLRRGSLDISGIEFFVLDEADEMLDMGFIEDIEAVMGMMGDRARVVLFSATMPGPIISAVRSRVGEIETIEDAGETLTTELTEQVWLEVHERDRLEALSRVIDAEVEFYGIVFVSTKVEADRVAKALEERGYGAEAIHGDLSQEARERVLGKFRDRRIGILVATDVAARGIDIEKLSHVVNWSLPHDPDSYLHRVGRTGRAGNEGMAITFVTPDEYRKLFRLRQVSGKMLRKGSVPGIDGLIATKRGRLLARIRDKASAMLVSGAGADDGEDEDGQDLREAQASAAVAPAPAEAPWLAMADELMADMEPREALAAALAEGFGTLLDPGKYREITEVSVDATGVSRLYVGIGKKDRATPRAVADVVKRLSGLPDRMIGGIEVYDAFSFVTIPFKATEKTIAAARAAGGFPKVRLATPRGQGRPEGRPESGSPGGWRNRRGPESPQATHGAPGGFHGSPHGGPRDAESGHGTGEHGETRPSGERHGRDFPPSRPGDRPLKPRLHGPAARGVGTKKGPKPGRE